MRTRLLWLGLLFTPVALAADVDALAENLAQLRGEVEALSNELTLEKEDLRSRLRAMAAQKADLQVQVRQQELRAEQLDQAVEAEREAREAHIESTSALVDPVRDSIHEVRGVVQEGVPFHTEQRLGELDGLESALDGGEKTPREVASALWSFCEDEKRLARENALDRQVVELDGESMLVDVARLGMVALFFKTDAGEVGQAIKGAGWSWERIEDAEERARVLELFGALEKQIRVGLFELPLEVTR